MSDLEIVGIMCLAGGGFFAVFVPFIVWLLRRVTRGLVERDRALAAYAQARGLRFATKPPRAWGTFEGVSIAIGVYMEGPHGQSTMRTRVRSPLLGVSPLPDQVIQEQVARFPRALRVDRGPEIALSWSGYETDPQVLDEACRLAVLLAR